LPHANQGPGEPRQPTKELNTEQFFDGEVVVVKELAQFQQKAEKLCQEQENIMRRRIASQCDQTMLQ
jgi:hypothetical protein